MRFPITHCIGGIVATLLFTVISCLLVAQNAHYLPKSVVTTIDNFRPQLLQNFDAVKESSKLLSGTRLGSFVEYLFQMCVADNHMSDQRQLQRSKDGIHLVVVACGNRLEETLVNIKSSLLFTKSRVFYHIFAEENLHAGFKDGINSWPLWYRRNLLYTLYPITYPDDGNEKNWKKLFKPCASQRLFLPLVLSETIDSVLYVDTDILFLTDVLEFWSFFKSFNDSQLSSLCVEHVDKSIGWYNRFARHPYYGTTGVNSGVMLMNLTRMRNVMFKNDLITDRMRWEDMLLPLYNKYRYNITWGDQDLLNIVFHHNPELLHIFPCEYNYRPDHCMYGQTCKEARESGVKILHGNRGVYHNQKQPAFRAVFEAIQNYQFQQSYSKYIIEPLEEALAQTSETYCGKEKEAILKGLRNIVKNRN